MHGSASLQLFQWCGYFWGPWVPFVTTDEFSVRVTKITSGYSKTSHPLDHYSVFQITCTFKRSDKYVPLWNLCIYFTWKNVKKSCKNNKLKISAPTWNDNIWITCWIIFCTRCSRLFWVYNQTRSTTAVAPQHLKVKE